MTGSNDLNTNVVLTANTQQYDQSMDQSAQRTNQMLNSVTKLSTGLDNLTKSAGRKLELFGGGGLAGLAGATMAASRYEEQLGRLHAQATLVGGDMGKMDKSIDQTRKTLGLTTGEATNLYGALSKMGQAQGDLQGLTKTFTQLSSVTGEGVAGLASGMTTLQRTMGTQGVEQAKRYSMTLADLSTNAGVSAQGILDFSNNIAPLAKVAGMTQNQVMGVSTAFTKAGADGYAAGNAFQSLITGITQSVQAGSPDLAAYSNLIGVSTDQFTKMAKNGQMGEIVSRMFESFNKQGSNAIVTLQRFGLDGIRTYKALQAVAQQGGIGQYMNEATQDYQHPDTDKYNKAVKESLGGLSHEASKAREEVKMVGEAFGAAFVPGVTKGMQAVNAMLSPLTSLLKTLGSIPGAMAALGFAGTAGMGMLLKHFTGLSALSLGRSALNVGRRAMNQGPIGGFREGLNAPVGPAPAGVRGMGYRAGQAMSPYWQRYQEGRTGGDRPGVLRTARNLASFAGQTAIRGAGTFMRGTLTNLYPSAVISGWRDEHGIYNTRQAAQDTRSGRTLSARLQGTAAGMAQAARAGGQQAGEAGTSRMAGAIRGMGQFASAQAAASRASLENASATRAAMRETVAFGASLARAGAGTAMLGGRAAGGMALRGARAGARGLGSLAASAGGMLWNTVGPIGVAMGAMYLQGKHGDSVNQTMAGVQDPMNAAVNKYAAALGQATQATTSFADSLKHHTNTALGGLSDSTSRNKQDINGAMQLTASDERYVNSRNTKYTNPDVAKYSNKDLVSYAQATLGSNPTAGEVQAMSMDILRRTGDRGQAQQILDQAQKKKTVDFGSQFSSIDQRNGGIRAALNSNQALGGMSLFGHRLGIGDSEDSRKLAGSVAQSANAFITNAGNDTEQARAALTIFNQAISSTGSHGFSDSHASAIAGILAPGDKDQQKKIQSDLMKFKKFGNEASDVSEYQQIAGKDSVSSQLSRLQKMAGSDYNVDNRRLSAIHTFSDPTEASAWNKAYAPYGGRDTEAAHEFQNTLIGEMVSPYFAKNAKRGQKSNIYNEQLSGDVLDALNNPADTDKQAKASDQLAQHLVDLTGSVSGAKTELEQMKARAGSTSDPLYQLAANAENAADKVNSYATAYMTTAQRNQSARHELDEATAHKDEGGDSYQRYMNAKDQYEQAKASQYQRNVQIATGARELNVGISRSTADFAEQQRWTREDHAKQVSRSNEDFAKQQARSYEDFGVSRRRQSQEYYIQMSRSESDYNLQRFRSQEQFGIQRRRELQDYNTQRARAEQEFAIQRNRAMQEFGIQQRRAAQQYSISMSRANRDFNIQQKRGLYEFNLSRKRQEEDYNHQVVLMAKDSAKQVYDIYQRVTVQQTQSIENLMQNMTDQNQRLAEQQENLAKLRRLGISDDVIQQMGLNDAQNAQQLARMVDELMNDPKMVGQFNKQIKDRIAKAGKLTADPANQQWKEMQRSFNLNLKRSQEDFNRQVRQNRTDFRRSLTDQRQDYKRQMSQAAQDFHRQMVHSADDFQRQMRQGAADFAKQRAREVSDFSRQMRQMQADHDKQMTRANADFRRQRNQQLSDFHKQMARSQSDYSIMMARQNNDFEVQQARTNSQFHKSISRMRADFNRQYTEISGDFNDMAKLALKALSGTAKQQAEKANRAFKETGDDTKTFLDHLVKDVIRAAGQLGVDIDPISNRATKARINKVNNQLSRYGDHYADGGKVKGNSPHSKADNIPAMLTANEFVHPVDSVRHYGDRFMERVRNKEFPKEIAQHYASGGKVTKDAPNRGPAQGVSWPWQWGVVHRHFPNATLTSNYRPGAITRGGGQQSYHAIGRAIDIGPGSNRPLLTQVAKWLLANYGNASHDLLYSPLWGHMGIYEGKWYRQPDTTYRDHFNHVHWGYKKNPPGKGAPQSNPAGYGWGDVGGMTKAEFVAELKKMPAMKFFSKAMSKSAVTGKAKSPWLENLIAQAAEDSGALMGAGGVGGQAAPKEVKGAIALGKKMAAARGWTGRNWDALYNLWMGESNWNYRAANPFSGAYGIPQSLPGNKMASAGSDWRTNPKTQIKWGMNYIAQRYHTPAQAYGQWLARSPHWYGDGTDNAATGINGVGERGAEIVLGPTLKRMMGGEGVLNSETTSKVIGNALAAKQAMLKANSVPSASQNIVYHVRTDASTNFHGNISVEAKDPTEFVRKMKEKKRLAALTGVRA